MTISGQLLEGACLTQDGTGVMVTPTVGPTAVLYIDGVANAAVVTITGSNPYKWSVQLPALAPGQTVQILASATIAGIAASSFVMIEQVNSGGGLINTNVNVEELTEPVPALRVYRDTTISLEFFAEQDYRAATNIWFTIKDDLDELDTNAIVQIDLTTGLLYLDSIAQTGAQLGYASLVVSATTIVINISTDASVFLPIYHAKPVYWDIKADIGGVVSILQSGEIYILPTPTRTV